MNKNSIIPAIHLVLGHILSFPCSAPRLPVKMFCKNVGVALAMTIVAKATPTEFGTPLTMDSVTPLANDVSPELDNDEIHARSNLIKSPLPPLFQRGELNTYA